MSEHNALNHGNVQDTLSCTIFPLSASNFSYLIHIHFVKFTEIQIKLMLDLRRISFVFLLSVACNFPFAVNSVRHFIMAFFLSVLFLFWLVVEFYSQFEIPHVIPEYICTKLFILLEYFYAIFYFYFLLIALYFFGNSHFFVISTVRNGRIDFV